jgi:SAM-dependent methyltransferase
MVEPDRALVRQLAAESLARGDATGWFDEVYRAAEGSSSAIPWADGQVNPSLANWLTAQVAADLGKLALVVGCGLGDDAEELAALGLAVTAFDISPTAVEWCRKRFPQSTVEYRLADLLAPPPEWQNAFDFVFEAFTLQSLPPEPRAIAASNLGRFVAPGGKLLVIARARDATEPTGTLPWPLTRDDLSPLLEVGLEAVSFEDYYDAEHPPVRRLRVTYRRPA